MTGATNGQINNATAPFSTGGGGAVTSVFGRTGAVTAQTGDYTIAQISGAGTAAAENLTAVITDDGAGGLTIGAGQVTLEMLANGISPSDRIVSSSGYGIMVQPDGSLFQTISVAVSGTGTNADLITGTLGSVNGEPYWAYNAGAASWYLYYDPTTGNWVISQFLGESANQLNTDNVDYWTNTAIFGGYGAHGPSGYPSALVAQVGFGVDVTGNVTAPAFITAGGTNAQVVLGDGTLGTYGSGSPGGTSGNIQYNNAGAFGGFGTYDPTADGGTGSLDLFSNGTQVFGACGEFKIGSPTSGQYISWDGGSNLFLGSNLVFDGGNYTTCGQWQFEQLVGISGGLNCCSDAQFGGQTQFTGIAGFSGGMTVCSAAFFTNNTQFSGTTGIAGSLTICAGWTITSCGVFQGTPQFSGGIFDHTGCRGNGGQFLGNDGSGVLWEDITFPADPTFDTITAASGGSFSVDNGANVFANSLTLCTGAYINTSGDINAVHQFLIGGTSGITTTVTTSSLVGKTLTITGGIITGFA